MNEKLSWSEAIKYCHTRGEPWVLITLINTRGSAPRDSGSKMVVTLDDLYDTVGGGQLEFELTQKARAMIAQGTNQQAVEHIPLSTKANQCCGGSVTVLLECFAAPRLDIQIFGAGHVAQALVSILGQLDARLTWVDARENQFPRDLPTNTRTKNYDNVLEHIATLTSGAFVLILTHDHALDYALLEALLDRKDCAFIGMIGSETKAQRFRKRLKSASFSQNEIDSVHSPIGLSAVPGKQPIEIAVSIAAQIIQLSHQNDYEELRKKSSGLAWQEIKEVLNKTQTVTHRLPALEHKK